MILINYLGKDPSHYNPKSEYILSRSHPEAGIHGFGFPFPFPPKADQLTEMKRITIDFFKEKKIPLLAFKVIKYEKVKTTILEGT